MTNDAWADDPDLRVRGFDDPDSQSLLKGLGLIFWPRPTFIIIGWLGVLLFGFVAKLVLLATAIWVGAHFLFRPAKFIAELRAGFAFIAGFVAKRLPKRNHSVTQSDRASEAMPEAQSMQRPFAALASAEAPLAAEPAPAPAPKPARKAIDWRDLTLTLGDGFFRLLPLIVIVVLVLFLVSKCDGLLDGPSGREVAAEYNQRAAEVERSVAEAESRRSEEAIVIVEDTHQRRRRAQAQTEEAREAIAAAPEIDTGFSEYRARALSLRDEGRAPAAAAVQQHTAEQSP